MTYGIYTIKDELSGYGAPMMLENNKSAERYFANLTKTSDLIKNNPKDFSIWRLGDFDTEEGRIIMDLEKSLIIRGESVANYGE